MAARTITTDQTLEDLRLQFNALSEQDFGDIGDLDSSIVATTIVGAVNELSDIVAAGLGFYIEDSTSTVQLVGGGETIKFLGTSNETEVVVSAPDTVTIGLPNDVTIGNDLTVTNDLDVLNDLNVTNNLDVTNNLTVSGDTITLGTVEITGNTIRSTDSTRLFINDTLRATGLATQNGNLRIDETAGFGRIASTRGDGLLVFNATPIFNSSLVFEGSSADDFETTLTVTNPTADRTITIPNITGTLVTTGDTNTVTETMIAEDAVGANQLKDVQTLQILDSTGSVLKTLYAAGS